MHCLLNWLLIFVPYFAQVHLLHPYYRSRYPTQGRLLRLAILPFAVLVALTLPLYPQAHFHGDLILFNYPPYMLVAFLLLKIFETALTGGDDFYMVSGATPQEWEECRLRQANDSSLFSRILWTFCCVTDTRGIAFAWCPERRTRLQTSYSSSSEFFRSVIKTQTLYYLAAFVLFGFLSLSVHTQDLPAHQFHDHPVLAFLAQHPTLLAFLQSRFTIAPNLCFHVYLGLATLYNWAVIFAYVAQTYLPYLPPFNPALWPPMFNFFSKTGKLQNIHSLRTFWSIGWHSIFKRSFFFFGIKPISRLPIPKMSMIILSTVAVFSISGFIHEFGLLIALALQSHSRGNEDLPFKFPGIEKWFRTNTFWFFALQSLGVILEGVMCLKGFVGTMFTVVWMVLTGSLLVDDWIGLTRYKDIMPPVWEWKSFLLEKLSPQSLPS